MWNWWNSTDLGLVDIVTINLNAEIVACVLSFRKLRHKLNLENTSKYGFSPDLGGKNGGVLSMRMQVILDSSFACPGSVPIWGGKKGEFRDWTNTIYAHELITRAFQRKCPSWNFGFVFSSFFASYDAMNEYCGDRNVYRKLSTVDGNDTWMSIVGIEMCTGSCRP